MDREKALQQLGLDAQASDGEIQTAYKARGRSIKRRILAASHDTEKLKYTRHLARLRRCRDVALDRSVQAAPPPPPPPEPEPAPPPPPEPEPERLDRATTLQHLGVAPDAKPAQILAAYKRLSATMKEHIRSAPNRSLKNKYKADTEVLAGDSPVIELDAAGAQSAAQTASSIPPRAQPGAVGLHPGDTLASRYEIRQVIGAGSIGAVYRAYDRSRNHEIAIKALVPGLIHSEPIRERFLNEAQISVRLSHPNIVSVFDVATDGGLHFLTMELLQGRTLREELQRRGPLEVDEVRKIGATLSKALSYAHEFTIHRDVKPENIFVCEDGTLKLMDFGIARDIAVGTAEYMAPEQRVGARDLDHRADQYSLAVVLYELLAGHVPTGHAKSVREVCKGVSRGVSAVLDRALQADRDDRFPDMASFSKGLKKRLRFF